MNDTTLFQDVAEAAAYLAEDPQVALQVRDEISKNELVAHLLEFRLSKGLTQAQIAESMGCDASTVSRIESDSDRQLQWKDVVGYAQALDLQINILFDDCSLPAADRIKHCVLKIDGDLKKLAALAEEIGGADEITHEIDRFYKQVLFNFLARFQEHYSKVKAVVKIPPCPPTKKSLPGKAQGYSIVEPPVGKRSPSSASLKTLNR